MHLPLAAAFFLRSAWVILANPSSVDEVHQLPRYASIHAPFGFDIIRISTYGYARRNRGRSAKRFAVGLAPAKSLGIGNASKPDTIGTDWNVILNQRLFCIERSQVDHAPAYVVSPVFRSTTAAPCEKACLRMQYPSNGSRQLDDANFLNHKISLQPKFMWIGVSASKPAAEG